jgi:hypothetical protein
LRQIVKIFMISRYTGLLLVLVLLNSCVSSSQYFKQVEDNKLLNEEIRSLGYLREQNEKMKATLTEQNEELYLCEDKLKETEQRVRSLVQQNQVQQQDQLKMNERNKALLEKAFEDKKSLTDELIAKQVTINQKDKQIKRLEMKLAGKAFDGISNVENNSNSQSLTVTSVLPDTGVVAISNDESFEKLIRNLQGIAPGEFLVELKPGDKMIVSLNESMLFEQNSTKLSDKGKNALFSLIRLLTSQNVKNVRVENSMDTGKSESQGISLRTGRLLSVYYSFLESGINPKQMVVNDQKTENSAQAADNEPVGTSQKIKIEFDPFQVKN